MPAPSGKASDTPLATLLSWVLLAYTIELDNEFEHAMAQLGSRRAFRVSLVMWDNFLRLLAEAEPEPEPEAEAGGSSSGGSGGRPAHAGDTGPPALRLGDLPARAGLPKTHAYLAMERWGYVVVAPDPADTRPKPPRRDWLIRPTAVGESAMRVWRPLPAAVEQRWRERFGTQQLDDLRAALAAVVAALGVDRPRYLPVVTYGMAIELAPPALRGAPPGFDPSSLGLSALLSLVLLELTADFERRSSVSLAVSANVLRLGGRTPLRLQELRRRAGISREAIAIATGYLERNGLAVLESTPPPERARTFRLTPKGEQAAKLYGSTLDAIEQEWAERYGEGTLAGLRRSLARIVVQRNDDRPLLAAGLAPLPGNWRAERPYLEQTETFIEDPTRLPHHPVVTHRGGWPDGS